MYEVRHRSVWEHEQFSLTVERHNLKWLHEANRDFIHEVQRINHLDQMADTASLKGAVFKKKALDEDKVKGLGALGLSMWGYFKLQALSLMVGTSVLPSVAVVGGLMYGLNKFSEKQTVS